MELFIYEYCANADLPGEPLPHASASPQSMEIRTCQRTLKISVRPLELSTARRFFEGSDAYEFLMRFASGLESEIKGETDVFGQVKTAFKNFSQMNPEFLSQYQTLFSNLFEDTKEIRAQFLQGIGGNTYGALARRVLNPEVKSKVLILGAGQISKSVAPYFADSELTIYNRSELRLGELSADLTQKGYQGIRYLSGDAELSEEIKAAEMVIIATPVGSVLDALVISNCSPSTRILHLGAQAHEITSFETLTQGAQSLSDLFALEKEQSLFREKQIQQAMDACRRRALLRSLSRSIHIHHGWEDLALFY